MRYLTSVFIFSLFFSAPSFAQSWWEKGLEMIGAGGDDKTETVTETSAPAAATPPSGIKEQLLKKANSVSVGEVTGGLKDALKLGTDKVVSQLGKEGGFNTDPAIHIPLPGQLQKVKDVLDKAGMGGSFAELETKLNKAAESATPQTKALFMDAIDKMTIADAQKIYEGENDSATQYFKATMSAPLKDVMRPIIDTQLSEVGAVKTFDSIMKDYKNIPFVPDVKADLTEHTLNKGLDGIFHYLANEEAAIRKDPAKQTTNLLKKIFGGKVTLPVEK